MNRSAAMLNFFDSTKSKITASVQHLLITHPLDIYDTELNYLIYILFNGLLCFGFSANSFDLYKHKKKGSFLRI